jgi:protein-S-isoprenylcysteine O-methyltransferase Ste14
MNYLVLAAGTVILVIISWLVSIKEKRYHGITRFFSFESIFILFLLNWRMWFHDPFSWNQLIAWILLFLSIYPVVAGFILLKRKGKSEISLENTTALIKSGIYHHIRHPLYCSLLLLGTGIMFKDPGLLQIIAGAVNIIALFFTAKIEEKEMIERFGDQYADYMKETKMFIPYLI